MTYKMKIFRRERGKTESFFQSFFYTAESESDTVASALTFLNAQSELTDADGAPARKIEWECSCLQKKCGACAMLINHRPRLACDAVLKDLGGEEIVLQPLSKFPLVCDLIVDRSILTENLKTLELWLKDRADLPDSYRKSAYEASGCIQCGCCLEVCPNFYPGGGFAGMAAVPVTLRLLAETPVKDARRISRLYASHIFEGCGKSLACKSVCPKKLDTEDLLVNANALAIWKRRKKK